MLSNSTYMYNEVHFEVEYWDSIDPYSRFVYPDGSLNLERATAFNVLVLRYYMFYDMNSCIVFHFSIYHPMVSETSAIDVFQDMTRCLSYMKYDILVAYLMPNFVHVAFPVVELGIPYLKLPDPQNWQRFLQFIYGTGAC